MESSEDAPPVKKPEKVTLKSVNIKVDDILEMTDILHTELKEVKEVLKSLLELQLNIQNENKKQKGNSLPDYDTMFS